jgi:hypothetical protein
MMKPAHPIFVAIALAVIGSAFAAHGPESHSIQTTAAKPASWQSLFDGKTLGKWQASDFDDNGKIEIAGGTIRIGVGKPMAGITWSGEPPARTNYEIELEAMRTEGHDFFCGLTFPVGKDPCTLICGGWGGSLVGLSSIDGNDASENSTSTTVRFENQRWYKIRVRVTPKLIEAWIDDEQIVNLELEGHRIGIRWEVEASVPLGISTWKTASALRNLRWRKLD